MESLTHLAKKDKKTVLWYRFNLLQSSTIHQPRTDILNLFDKIILLAAGKLVWFGTTADAIAHFATLGYPLPPKTNPSDYFLDTATIDRRSPERQEASTARVEKFVAAYSELCVASPKKDDAVVKKSNAKVSISWPSTYLQEYRIILHRSLTNNFRDTSVIGATFGMNIFTTLLILCLFFRLGYDTAGIQNREGLFFFFTINLAMGNIMPVFIS